LFYIVKGESKIHLTTRLKKYVDFYNLQTYYINSSRQILSVKSNDDYNYCFAAAAALTFHYHTIDIYQPCYIACRCTVI